jgi:hypothetical protein
VWQPVAVVGYSLLDVHPASAAAEAGRSTSEFEEPMGIHHYHFRTRWRVEATAAQAFELIDGVADYVRWWPAV